MPDLPEFELDIRAGVAFQRTFPITQGNSNAPVPFSSVVSGRAHVKESYNNVTTLHEFAVSIVDIGGRAHARLSANGVETATFLAWPTRTPLWDLEVTDSDGKVHMITDIGKIRIKPRITS